MSQVYGRKVARGLEQMEAALEEVEELEKLPCRVSWMFNRPDAAQYQWVKFDELEDYLY